MDNFFKFVNQTTGELVTGEKGTIELKKAYDKAMAWFNAGNGIKVYYGGQSINRFLTLSLEI